MKFLAVALLALIFVGCSGSSSPTGDAPTKPQTPSTPVPQTETPAGEEAPAVTPAPEQTPAVNVNMSPMVTELKAAGIEVVIDSDDPNGVEAEKVIGPHKAELLKRKDKIKKVSYKGFCGVYDAVTKHFCFYDRFEVGDFTAIDDMAAFSKDIGITVDTGSLIPRMAWPKLKAKLAKFKLQLKARNQTIKKIQTININDFFGLGNQTLFVNEESEAAFLKEALSYVDQSIVYLRDMKDIRVNMQTTMSTSQTNLYFTLNALSKDAKTFNALKAEHGFQQLMITDSMHLQCEARKISDTKMVQVFAFSPSDIKSGCSPHALVERIRMTMELQKSLDLEISVQEFSGTAPILLVAPVALLNVVKANEALIKQSPVKVKSIVFREHFGLEKPGFSNGNLVLSSQNPTEIKSLLSH